jgi:hypothetical protein
MASQSKLEADVRKIMAQGGDPSDYRQSLASLRGVPVEMVDAAIAAVGGSPADIHPEDVAQRRLAEDRAFARTNRAAWRAYNHKEE